MLGLKYTSHWQFSGNVIAMMPFNKNEVVASDIFFDTLKKQTEERR